jgi:hypothetical protein
MSTIRFSFRILTLASFVFAFCAVAQAQAIRTWVSGTGDDFNPCSRTAPCKTFAGAIPKTAVNGEINCLDPGGYGAVTITKSITIDCEDTQGSIIAAGVTGINISLMTSVANDPLSTVRIRGLSINGAGSCGDSCGTATGIRGINVSSGNNRPIKVFVDEVFIQNFVNEGIMFNAPGGDLFVRDSLITNVIGTGAVSGAGIRALSSLAGQTGVIHVGVTRATVKYCTQGIRFEGNVTGSVDHSVASNNSLNGLVVFPTTNGNAEMNVTDSTASDNRQFGVFAGGTTFSGTVRIFNLTSFNNTTSQLEISAGGAILSNTRNHIGTPTDAPGPFTDQ